MKLTYSLVTYSGMGGHPALSFVGPFLLAGAPDSFGSAVETIDVYAHLSHAGARSPELAALASRYDSRLRTLPRAWFKRKNRLLEIAYASEAGTAEDLFESRTREVQQPAFLIACEEVLALLPLVEASLKPTDQFDLGAMRIQLETRVSDVPSSAADLERMLKPLRVGSERRTSSVD